MPDTPPGRVLFVDDDAMVRRANTQTLALAGLVPTACASAAEALAIVDANWPGVVVTDVRMPGMDGLALFRTLRAIDPDLPVILITGHGDVPMAVAALKDGAWDFLPKPFGAEQFVASVRRALTTRQLVVENRALRDAARRASEGDALIGETPVMQDLRAAMRHLAATDADILIEGAAGTGKALAATVLHRWSKRRARPLVTFEGGVLPMPAAQGEMFGHAGGLPGHGRWSDGCVVGADGGTLFLDRLDLMPDALQQGMLRVLEEREVKPLGAERARPVDIRVIASVPETAERLVERGVLHPGLFLRLSAARLRMPPVVARRADVPLLFAAFADEAAARHRRSVPPHDHRIRTLLATHDWPGNVREIATIAEAFVLGVDSGGEALTGPDPALPLRVQRFEADAICAVLASHDGDVRLALQALQIPRKTFYDKVARYGIDLRGFRPK